MIRYVELYNDIEVINMHYKRIRELRQDHDYTQEQIAKYLKISRATYGHYETSRNEIPNIVLNKLADFYQVSVDYLMERTDISTPYPKSENKPNSSAN